MISILITKVLNIGLFKMSKSCWRMNWRTTNLAKEVILICKSNGDNADGDNDQDDDDET